MCRKMRILKSKRSLFLRLFLERVVRLLNVDDLEEETSRMVERIVVLRVATKHINQGVFQLEMKGNLRVGWVVEV